MSGISYSIKKKQKIKFYLHMPRSNNLTGMETYYLINLIQINSIPVQVANLYLLILILRDEIFDASLLTDTNCVLP